jgi:hypothetical protein
VAANLAHPSDIAVVNVLGVGSGVVERLREQRKLVSAFNAAGSSRARDRSHELGLVNQRAPAWWKMR